MTIRLNRALAAMLCAAALLGHSMFASAQEAEHPLKAQACQRILDDAGHVFDANRVLDRAFHSLHFRAWLCDSGFRSQAELEQSTRLLNMPNPDLGLVLGARLNEDGMDFADGLRRFCSYGLQLQLDPVIHAHFQRMASASMIDAVESCLQASALNVGQPYAIPENRALTAFTVHMPVNAPIEPVDSDGTRCTRQDKAGRHTLLCEKAGDRSASLVLRSKGQDLRLSLPGSLDLALAAQQEQIHILADRLRYLEHSLVRCTAATATCAHLPPNPL